MTSVLYFLPSAAASFSCLQFANNCLFLRLIVAQYILGFDVSAIADTTSTAQSHHFPVSSSQTDLTGISSKNRIDVFICTYLLFLIMEYKSAGLVENNFVGLPAFLFYIFPAILLSMRLSAKAV